MRPGDQIQGYRIREQIAVGGFGTVWRAQHADSGHIVAIKVLHAYLVSSEVLVKRFEHEAQAIALMEHPHIVQLYDAGRVPDGRPYLIMEFLEGWDLSTHITRRGTLLPREILNILEQLCSALSAAHAHDIVHRDLKASNVFLCNLDQGKDMRVVLFDFGIAKLLGRDGTNLTLSSSLVGSPACISPEQILGREVDARTDIYALGSLTYQMLVGHPPFSGASPTAILTMHLDDYPPYPSLYGDISPAFDNLVMKAMSKDPQARYQSAEEFVQAFREAVQHTESTAARGTIFQTSSAVPTRALGLYIDVGADPHALEDPEDALLDDMESIIPRAAEKLEDRGYLVAYERGMSALFVRPMPADAAADKGARLEEMTAVVALFDELEKRPHRDPHVRLRAYLHLGEVRIDGDTIESVSPLGPDWTPAVGQSGVFAADALFSGIESETVAGAIRRLSSVVEPESSRR